MPYLIQLLTVGLFCLFVAAVVFYPLWTVRQRGRFSPFSENRLRLPGESLRANMADLYGKLLYCFFSVYAVAMVFFLPIGFMRSMVGGAILMCVGAAVLSFIAYRINKIVQSLFNYKVGLEGEEYTGQELNLLARYGAYVFHDIPYKYGNIDHVVVGYDIVFVVETKVVRKPADQKGKKESWVEYDGRKLRFPHFTTDAPLRQAKRHADCLARVLNKGGQCSIPVIPVVALPGWFVRSNTNPVTGIRVINPKRGKFLRAEIDRGENNSEFRSAVRKVEKLARVDTPLASITDPDAAEHYNLWTNGLRQGSDRS